MSGLSKEHESALNAIKERRLQRKYSALYGNVHADYGVKGMKWGKRKEKESSGSKSVSSRPYESDNFVTEAGRTPHVKNAKFSKGMNDALNSGDRETFSRYAEGCEYGNTINAGSISAECVGGKQWVVSDRAGALYECSARELYTAISDSNTWDDDIECYDPQSWHE